MDAQRWARLLVLVGLLIGLYFAAPVNMDPPGGLVLRVAMALAVLVGLGAAVLTQVRRSAIDDTRGVDGLVGAIVGVLTVFAFAFFVLEVHRPDQLAGLDTKLDALYFSASTMLTIGYGDVHATGQLARALVLVQMVFDIIFVATAAGLLSTHVRRAAASRARQDKR